MESSSMSTEKQNNLKKNAQEPASETEELATSVEQKLKSAK